MKNENEERDELQEMVQQLSKEKQQSSKDESLDLKYNAIMSSGQLDREETTQKANLSSESYGCHSEVDSNGNDVEDLAALNEMQLLNSEDSREILQFFQISTSQYTVASSTYLKVNSSSRFEHCQHSRAMTELLGACDANIQYLQDIQFRLKTSDNSTDDNVTLVKFVKQLLMKWVQLDDKV